MSDAKPCCCQWGAAVGKRYGIVSNEWPEFECGDCPIHGQGLGPNDNYCRRHTKIRRDDTA